MTSDEINQRIHEICDDETFAPPELARHGKTIPYIGWFWRDVDFDKRITLGYCGSFIGFMENNKWDHDEWITTDEQSVAIREAAEAICKCDRDGLAPLLQRFYDLIQGCLVEVS